MMASEIISAVTGDCPAEMRSRFNVSDIGQMAPALTADGNSGEASIRALSQRGCSAQLIGERH